MISKLAIVFDIHGVSTLFMPGKNLKSLVRRDVELKGAFSQKIGDKDFKKLRQSVIIKRKQKFL